MRRDLQALMEYADAPDSCQEFRLEKPKAAALPRNFEDVALGCGFELMRLQLQLQGAALPRYSPAALALARSQKEVAGIVQREARGMSAAAKGKHSENEMAGGTALTKKQLARIVGAARAAAQKNNQLIFAADGALAASQKELGKDAVKVPIYACVCVHSIEMSLRAHTHDVDTRYRSFR